MRDRFTGRASTTEGDKLMDFKWDITKQVAGAVIRWILAGIAYMLVRHGIVDQQLADAWLGEATSILLGLAILAVPVIWRIIVARTRILELIKAVQTDPPADTPAEVR